MKVALFILFLLISIPKARSQSWVELNNLAIEFNQKGETAKALSYAERAVKKSKADFGDNHENYAEALNTYASILHSKGDYKGAETFYLRAKTIRETVLGRKNPDYANSLSNLGTLYLDTKQLSRAEPLLIESKELHELLYGTSHVSYALAINNLGVLYKEKGEYQKAIPLLEKASEIWEKNQATARLDYISSLNNLASIYSDAGQFSRAEPLYLKAKKLIYDFAGEKHPLYANCLNNLADFYANIQEYEKALPFELKACELTRNSVGIDHPDYATHLHNLSTLYLHLGRFQLAIPPCLETLRIWKKNFGTGNPNYAEGLVQAALLYEVSDQYNRAEPLLKEAIEIKKQSVGTNHPDYAAALNQLASFYYHKKDYKKAEPLFIEAIAIAKSAGESSNEYVNYSNNLAALYFGSGQIEKAGSIASVSNRTVIENTLKTFPVLSQKQKEEFIEKVTYNFDFLNSVLYSAGNPRNPLNAFSLDQAIVLKSVALFDARNLFESIRQTKDTSIARLFSRWLALKKILAKQYSLPPDKRASDLAKGESMAEDAEKELIRRSMKFRQEQQGIGIRKEDIQRALKPGEVSIEFVKFRLLGIDWWTDSIIYAANILYPNDPVPVFVPLCEEQQLAKYFLRDSVGEKAGRINRGIRKENTIASGDSLYALVWKPLLPYLSGVKKIDYSPAGLLNRIAFHALPAGDNQLLLDKYELNRYISTRQLAFADNEPQQQNVSIALFGNPAFTMDSITMMRNTKINEKVSYIYPTELSRGTGGEAWKDLTATQKEITDIRSLFVKNKIEASVYTGTNATEEWFKSLSGSSPTILHLATHGFFLPDIKPERNKAFVSENENAFTLARDPMLRSGIVLAGANRVWSGQLPLNGREDGIVTAYEISQLDLRNTNLVVLSACETALGDIKGTEGVFGLQRAFKLAGAKNMLLSLWKVPDAETAELMKTFYGYYLGGQSARDALNNAQKEMRKKYTPYYWAAFVLIE